MRRHAGQCQHGGHRPVHPPLVEDVAHRHLEQIADLALALRAAHVERHGCHEPGRFLVLEEDPAHLGSVAVCDHDLPAPLRHFGHDLGRDPS